MRGVAIAPCTIGELVDRHGGALDAGVSRDRSVASLGPSDREGRFDLAPVLTERFARSIVADVGVLLVRAALAERVPAGRRWIHPRADRVLAEILAERGSAAKIGESTIAEGVVIEPGAIVHPGVVLGRGVVIGAGSIVGRPGFGFVDGEKDGDAPMRIPHLAGVVIEDGVEIGALCTVDAGILAPTTIGRDTKIDSHVHVGHGVRIGARCRVAAQVGFAGSVVLGDDVLVGGQAGFADHVRVGDRARIAAKAGVIGDVPAGAIFAGYPAVARVRWLRGHARLYRE